MVIFNLLRGAFLVIAIQGMNRIAQQIHKYLIQLTDITFYFWQIFLGRGALYR
ncbi:MULTISPECIES: hypothetical protein [unclassified Microcoleus]|uniref:hypothetical protein n=1 Tax=unclassified Microcoleus TaxID=2642155 RepID=UPI002FD1F87E